MKLYALKGPSGRLYPETASRHRDGYINYNNTPSRLWAAFIRKYRRWPDEDEVVPFALERGYSWVPVEVVEVEQ